MKLTLYTFTICLLASGLYAQQSPVNIRLKDVTLMHEMRATPSPSDKAVVADRIVSFQWPLQEGLYVVESGLDGLDTKHKVDKSKVRYSLRYSQDPTFKTGVVQVETRWPFYNPEKDLTPGVWYWQYGNVKDGKTKWATVQQFTVETNPDKFCPPSLKEVLAKVPHEHPRVWLDKKEWEHFIRRSISTPERKIYISAANKAMKTPMKSINDVNTKLLANLNSEMERNAMLTRESRRIVDREESNLDVIIRAYMLTKERRYADEAIKRIKEIITWGESDNVKGDFNDATFVSLGTLAYDALYDLLDEDTRKDLLACIRKYGNKMYDHYNNYLENHIAENHVWQMTLRILTMAAFTVYGELPEADTWVDYCYNVWLARFPGLNKDGAWHNGDSYFTVNTRTLIEVPYFYSRLTGFDFFSDPWYQGSVLYTIYQQPPFSKSGGNGSSHEKVLTPRGVRVGYADAVARMTGNTYAADYVRTIRARQPNILNEGSTSKAGGLAWFRLQCDKPLPVGAGLADLPMGHVFPQSGLASFSTRLSQTENSAMISFRSSPYGGTSHALTNQNAFNTFWGGQSLFYSSGHGTSFIDKHSVYCYRATRAHNTILVNGMGQRIGTEGYGWIPRHYISENIGYVVGDASNAYGKVISPLWIERGKVAGLEYTPENGWDEVGLKTYRRHIVELGKTGLTFIYDELEAEQPVTWSYLLHTVTNPMNVDKSNPDWVHVQATNKEGISDAYLFSTGVLKTDTTSQFFTPAVNWLIADEKGNFKTYANHWHFTATSDKQKVYRFATIINTHAKLSPTEQPRMLKDGCIEIGDWNIKVNLSSKGAPSFFVRNTKKGENVSIDYKGKATIVKENGTEKVLVDKVPELEI
ncbi:DUF4962 domain-containing protein [uncultured Bacteroides sp.]|jgi:hypothetical protein|uniref:DUF4962 domain-containing protein n=1 Tax=uncultured Bacteroides sp. TaxID=162156 RepID=UPI002608AFE2|nr:DUF4962 domain-containing protein [uncultured Bacteroides sp.]